jgi:hypothetical protein
MKVHDLVDGEGRGYAFEVDNGLLTRNKALKVVSAIPGVKVLRTPKIFDSNEEFAEFELDGVLFKIWEPFGDNSRYWVGPDPPKWCEQIAVVREAFVQHKVLGMFG